MITSMPKVNIIIFKSLLNKKSLISIMESFEIPMPEKLKNLAN